MTPLKFQVNEEKPPNMHKMLLRYKRLHSPPPIFNIFNIYNYLKILFIRIILPPIWYHRLIIQVKIYFFIPNK